MKARDGIGNVTEELNAAADSELLSLLFELELLGPAPDEEQVCGIEGRGQSSERIEKEIEAFFGNEAADRDQGGEGKEFLGIWLFAANQRDICWIWKYNETRFIYAEFPLEFESHGPGLADDAIGVTVGEGVGATREWQR